MNINTNKNCYHIYKYCMIMPQSVSGTNFNHYWTSDHFSLFFTQGFLRRYILVNRPDATICAEFILSKCKNGSKCTGHHCFLPYHWQYGDAGEWKSFNEKENERIEKLYCNVTMDVIECSAEGMQISFERYVIVIIYWESCQINGFSLIYSYSN